jgi:hypothetical protein
MVVGDRVYFKKWDRRMSPHAQWFEGRTGEVIVLIDRKVCVQFGESYAEHCWLPAARLERVSARTKN